MATKASLAWEVVLAYARVRRELRRSDIRDVLATLRASPARRAGTASNGDPLVHGRRLGRAVSRTLAVLPGDTRCLSQSLVLTQLLAWRGIDSRVVIGVRPGERFAAHAWVMHGDAALLPPGHGEFEELVTL
jgi:hypothetical protein